MKSKQNKDQANFEKIEQYLNKKITGKAKQAFERDLKLDDDLRKEVDLHKDLASYLGGGASEDALRKNLNKIGNSHRRKNKMVRGSIIFLLLLILLGLVVFYFNKTSPSKEMLDHMPTNQESQQIDPPIPTNEKAIIIEQIAPSKKTKPQASIKANSLPIAANFKQNPLLESHLGNSVRGGTYHFEITQSLFIKEKAKTTFVLNGSINTDESPIQSTIQVHLFSNSKEDYESFAPLASSFLSYSPSENGFTFEVKEALKLAPGLYYYLIEDTDSGEIYKVDRIRFE